MRHSLSLLAAERDTFEALDLAHHLLDSRPRFVEDFCEELRLVEWCAGRSGQHSGKRSGDPGWDRQRLRNRGGSCLYPSRECFASNRPDRAKRVQTAQL